MKTKIVTTLLMQTLLAIILGLIISVVANLFIEGARYFLSLQSSSGTMSVRVGNIDINLLPTVAMVLSAILILTVRKLLGVTKWSGPADSIYALHQQKVGVDVRVGIGSTLAAFISASGGASVGQYGPLVHFGATLATVLSRIRGLQISKDVLLACGVAAAISAGFNAPIAGIIFAHEALLRRFSIGAVAPISVASIVASASNHYFGFANLAFEVPLSNLELIEVVPFLIVFAPICSAVAIIYMLALRQGTQFAASGRYSFTTLIFSTALVVGIIGAFLPDVLGLGSTQINQMVNGQYALTFLILLLVAKILVTAACIAFGFFGGVFGPALFVGAALGGILSGLLIQVGLPSDYGSIITVATLAAVGSSVIGAPLSVVLIVVELTGSYDYGLMALLSVTLCSTLTYRFFGVSYFDRQLLDRGIDLTRGREHINMTQIRVSELQMSECLTFPRGTTSAHVLESMRSNQITEAYILNGDNTLHGKLDLQSLISSPDDFENSLDLEPVKLDTSNSLVEALEIATEFVGESIPIMDGEQFKGAITEGDLFKKVLDIEDSLRA
ncbi:MAG TPA: voltage-gated chloride channel [Gammaproteobacteria bacterium]|nr:voltage-gated chloride channel [Gammaproteobacteria bacterium]